MIRLSSALLPLVLLAPPLVGAAVSVAHKDPEAFTDASDRSTDAATTMKEIKAHLEKLGRKYAPDADIRIEVLDVDRAGNPKVTRNDVRLMTGRADFPCIEVSAATAGSAPVRERVCDMNYLRSFQPGYHGDEPLVHEKRMLDVWFKKRFAANASKR